jgi:hypothetical protein
MLQEMKPWRHPLEWPQLVAAACWARLHRQWPLVTARRQLL